jgi:type II secretory pathway pseudopilin PulG
LIELLVVIAIIAVLAGMIFPIMKAVNTARTRSRAQSELTQIETAIETYKIRNGQYPPDNNGTYTLNQLYFELAGTTLSNGVYKTLDGSCQIDATQVSNVFKNVSGFVNCTGGAGGDEGQVAKDFLIGLRPDQTAELDSGAKVLVGPVLWPAGGYQPVPSPPAKTAGINTWCYNSSHPINNPNGYDLWIDVMIGGKINRVCNWSKKVLVVTSAL